MNPRIVETLSNARERLRGCVDDRGAFVGELSSSALSTATAAMALAMAGEHALAAEGHAWLARHQNDDGGWGDTTDSPTNISTTLLVWSSLVLTEGDYGSTLAKAEEWLREDCGGELSPDRVAQTIRGRYGKDQTFSVPILTTCALAGRLGADGWRLVPALPFELAALPHQFFHLVRLTTVSYALPALIAIGQVRHFQQPSRNPLTRVARDLTRGRTLRKLTAIQPASGGFLEAAPLTSFVAMALLAMGMSDHPVVAGALRFLRETVRDDGSWPIDTNLDTWITTLSVNALGQAEPQTLRWLRDQQYTAVHPYTRAAPGGWAWTDLTGGVPDADDTAGALLALRRIAPDDVAAAQAGVRWLCDLANRDGGVPTFCKGWGHLPFDQSSPDITAHALRAWQAWRADLPPAAQGRIDDRVTRAARYLIGAQRRDGAFIPLWFGNQHTPNQENPIYGTSRVVLAAATVQVPTPLKAAWQRLGQRGIEWLLAEQAADGGYGSIEETALALEALAEWLTASSGNQTDHLAAAVTRAAEWLAAATDSGHEFPATPIGLYFAKLWYWERLYPLVFTVSALAKAERSLADGAATRVLSAGESRE